MFRDSNAEQIYEVGYLTVICVSVIKGVVLKLHRILFTAASVVFVGCGYQSISNNGDVYRHETYSDENKAGTCRVIYEGTREYQHLFSVSLTNHCDSSVYVDPYEWFYTTENSSSTNPVYPMGYLDVSRIYDSQIGKKINEEYIYSDSYVEYGHNSSLLISSLELANTIKHGEAYPNRTEEEKRQEELDRIERKQDKLEWEVNKSNEIQRLQHKKEIALANLFEEGSVTSGRRAEGQVYFRSSTLTDTLFLHIPFGVDTFAISVPVR